MSLRQYRQRTRVTHTMYRLIITLFAVQSARAAESCPNVVPISDFNTTAYIQGVWYEVGRYNNKWESRGDCVTLTHRAAGGRVTFVISTVYDNKLTNVEGDITFDARKGYIDYVSKVYQDAEGTNTVPVEILMADYDKYIVVYYCALINNGQKHVYSWILSRTKRLDDESLTKIKQFFSSSNYLDLNKIVWDHFDEKTCKVN